MNTDNSDSLGDADLLPSEALYAFAGWLTSSEPPVTMSASHEAGTVAVLVDEFCKSQGFAEPRDGWTDRLKKYPARGGVTRRAETAGLGSEGLAPGPEGTRQEEVCASLSKAQGASHE